jgi:hypothetical protein
LQMRSGHIVVLLCLLVAGCKHCEAGGPGGDRRTFDPLRMVLRQGAERSPEGRSGSDSGRTGNLA